MTNIAEEMRARYDVERDRIDRLYDNREIVAQDRIDTCSITLERLQASHEPLQRQAIPLWEANLERARQELASLGNDRTRSVQELTAAMMPEADYRLLAVARIEIVKPSASEGGEL